MAEDTPIESPATGSGTGTQLFQGLLWLAITVWVAHATLTGVGGALSGAFAAAVAALPGVVATTMLTSASIGSAASSRFRGAGRRLLVGLAVGVLFGLAAVAGIRFAYGATSSVTVLALTVGAASLLGGAAAMLPNPVLEAALWAATWVFFAGVIFGVLQSQLATLLGGGAAAGPSAQTAANLRLAYAESALTGLLAGVYAFRSLRGERARWAWYPLAGALPGLLLLTAETLTRLGGASLVTLVNGFRSGATTLVALTDAARLRHALIVFGIGGIVAAIGAARTLRDRDEEVPPE